MCGYEQKSENTTLLLVQNFVQILQYFLMPKMRYMVDPALQKFTASTLY